MDTDELNSSIDILRGGDGNVKPETAEEAPARGEDGRFAPKEPQEQDSTEEQTAEEAPQEAAEALEPTEQELLTRRHVPSERLREEIARRQLAEEQFNEMRKQLQEVQQAQARMQQPPQQAEPVDYVDQLLNDPISVINGQMRPIVEQYSRRFAETAHGKEKVEQAYAALGNALRSGVVSQENIQYLQNKSPDPYGEIISWYEATMPIHDPETYKQKIIEEYKNSIQQTQPQQPQQQVKRNVIVPPSVNGARSVNRTIGDRAPKTQDEAAAFMESFPSAF